MSSNEATPRRRVRFAAALDICEYERDDVNPSDLYFSKELCHRNKDRAQRSGRHWQHKGFDVLLNHSYSKPAHDTQARLNAFAAEENDDSVPRGIERFISTKHADERRIVKIYCIEGVVDLNTYMRRHDKPFDEIEKELQDLSTKKSKRSRHFARRMAEADARWAAADAKVEEEPKPKKVLSRAIQGAKKFTGMIKGGSRNGSILGSSRHGGRKQQRQQELPRLLTNSL